MSERIIKILMDRDGMSQEEAEDLVEETRQDLLECFRADKISFYDPEDIVAENLGLEPDYVEDLLPF